ncbi:hypothetical protein FA09DRAFT_327810 [Tilletiopsis washingtonensis]|uniref:Uncharacterized protein n=1 Tax=Tilletiopsis washingtonensis TaxID=58919 RepID=A0A316ZH28_9BASI|nr:hypothetical protein FA09DRAFT_327810 [Tilletiopsis washingtonensis]PWO00359.1 hypothetical protein FA09DRAFT_327810 [Tilletiopsis washingtonensis]
MMCLGAAGRKARAAHARLSICFRRLAAPLVLSLPRLFPLSLPCESLSGHCIQVESLCRTSAAAMSRCAADALVSLRAQGCTPHAPARAVEPRCSPLPLDPTGASATSNSSFASPLHRARLSCHLNEAALPSCMQGQAVPDRRERCVSRHAEMRARAAPPGAR